MIKIGIDIKIETMTKGTTEEMIAGPDLGIEKDTVAEMIGIGKIETGEEADRLEIAERGDEVDLQEDRGLDQEIGLPEEGSKEDSTEEIETLKMIRDLVTTPPMHLRLKTRKIKIDFSCRASRVDSGTRSRNVNCYGRKKMVILVWLLNLLLQHLQSCTIPILLGLPKCGKVPPLLKIQMASKQTNSSG